MSTCTQSLPPTLVPGNHWIASSHCIFFLCTEFHINGLTICSLLYLTSEIYMLFHLSVMFSFLLLINIPLYRYTTFVYLLARWQIFGLLLIWGFYVKPIWKFRYKSLCKHMFSSLLLKTLRETDYFDHTVVHFIRNC